MAELFLFCVAVISAGVIWFYVVRPFLVDYGVIAPLTQLDEQRLERRGIMSRSERQTASEPGVPVPEPVPEPVRTTHEIDLRELAARLTYDEQLLLLAHLNDRDGRPYSSNRIAAFVGGQRADVLAALRKIRPSDATETPQPAPHITPIAKRPTLALFDDSELAYEPPPQPATPIRAGDE